MTHGHFGIFQAFRQVALVPIPDYSELVVGFEYSKMDESRRDQSVFIIAVTSVAALFSSSSAE